MEFHSDIRLSLFSTHMCHPVLLKPTTAVSVKSLLLARQPHFCSFALMRFPSDYDGAWPQQAHSSTPGTLTDMWAWPQQAHPTSPRSSECFSSTASSQNSGGGSDTPVQLSLHEVQLCSLPRRQFLTPMLPIGNSSTVYNRSVTMVLSGSTHQPLAKYLTWVDLSHLKQAAHLTLDSDCSVLATLTKTAHFACALSPSGATWVHTTHFILLIECWISAIDSIANFADTPTRKAITTRVLVARWILQGLQEKLTSFTKLCKHYSNTITPTVILNFMPSFLAPVVLSNGSSSRLCHQDLNLYLQAREPLKLLWQILPALQHYDHRFAIQVQEARCRAQQAWTPLYEHFRHGQRLMRTMQHGLAQGTSLGAQRLLEQELLPLAEQIVSQLQRATFQFYNI